jgi:osmotically-inducible protein OsmY
MKKNMRKNIVILFLFIITGCAQFMTEITEKELLHDRRGSERMAKDQFIETNALQKIEQLTELKQKERVKVAAYNGKVLMVGTLETNTIRDKFIANIRIIENIDIIYNELKVESLKSKNQNNKDELISKEISEVLQTIKEYPNFDKARVKVVVLAGNVYLMGLVYKEEAQRAATQIQKIENIHKIILLFEYIKQEKI